ncbi:MAG: GDP-mannose 4,6-dehydratase [Nitrospirae bacterium]|nr:GDP-mannose 4,6-dehydratase [Nitrospirota bacterium]
MKPNGKRVGPSWSSRRVLVTGATGIVGSWLVKELLARGSFVIGLIRDADPNSELLRSGDIRRISVIHGAVEDPETLERAILKHDADTVFHLAAQTIVTTAARSPLQTFEANIRGTYHLLEACRRQSGFVRRIVIASSDKAYGTPPRLPYREDMPLNGLFPYEVSKSCADLLARCYHRTYGLPVGIARCGNVYGGADLNWSRIVPGTIRSLLGGERPVIRSNGKYVRDYTYVKDVVRAYLRLADGLAEAKIRGEAFNFSSEEPVTVLTLVRRIGRLMGADNIHPKILDTASGEILSQHLSTAKARRLLGWRAKIGLKEGLRETIEWYRGFFGQTV